MDEVDEEAPVVKLERKWELQVAAVDKELNEALRAGLERQFGLELEVARREFQSRIYGVSGLPRPGTIVLS